MEKTKEEIKNLVLKMKEEGNVVFATIEGLMASPLKKFIKQPTEGILYDLNRDGATVMTFIDDPKWINDFAVSQVITELKKYYDYCVAIGIELK
jgi:hypothetical protein